MAATLVTGTPVAAGPGSPDRTLDFLQEAAGSDTYEIDAGRVALVEAQDPHIRAFAEQMIRDHTRTSQDLQSAAARSGLPPPPKTMSADQSRLLSALQSLKGADFDKAYLTQQVLAHTAALVVTQHYAGDGPDQNVKQAAQAATPVIEGHLRMAQQMKAAGGGA
jgi:putative membrane protein